MGDYKLVKSWTQDKVELFDLSRDLGENHDLSRTLPQKSDELHALMTDFLKQVGAETRQTEKKAVD